MSRSPPSRAWGRFDSTDTLGNVQVPRAIANRRYRLEEELGQGQLAVVYRAVDTKLMVDRAIKILPPACASFKEHLDRFMREARSMAQLHHPNIVDIHDVGVDGGWVYLIMEIMPGGTIREWIKREGAPGRERALGWSVQALRGLEKAHGAGIFHRDVRPGNLFLSDTGDCKVGDFGLATAPESGNPMLTRPGSSMGMMPFSAPESMTDARSVDGRADVHGIGVTLGALVNGVIPRDFVLKPDFFESLPDDIRPIVARATKRDRDERYDSISAMLRDLEAVM